MALYEMRTYTLYVGKMAEAQKLYTELGFPALKNGGHDKNLLGYFVADTGMIISSCTSGNSRTMATGAHTGRPCSRTRILSRGSLRSSDRW